MPRTRERQIEIMRKTQILGLALFAMLACSVIVVASAGAEALLWLVNGADFTGTLNAETEGLIELHKLVSPTNGNLLNTLHCEGIFDGTITNPAVGFGDGTDEVTKVLNLLKEEIGEELVGLAIFCLVTQAAEAADCKLNTEAEVWPEKLPWLTDLQLMTTAETWLDLFLEATNKTPGYHVRCETGIIGLLAEELCEGPTSALLTNDATTVPPSVLGEFNANSEEVNCTATGEKTGAQLGSGHTWATEDFTLNTRLETALSETA